LLKAASASALLNAFLMAMQIAIGLTAHSDGLFADGIHTLSDLAADSVVLIVLYLQRETPERNAARRGRQRLASRGIALHRRPAGRHGSRNDLA
jgi:Co/Zn/Cd efflux system component